MFSGFLYSVQKNHGPGPGVDVTQGQKRILPKLLHKKNIRAICLQSPFPHNFALPR